MNTNVPVNNTARSHSRQQQQGKLNKAVRTKLSNVLSMQDLGIPPPDVSINFKSRYAQVLKL